MFYIFQHRADSFFFFYIYFDACSGKEIGQIKEFLMILTFLNLLNNF